MGLLFPAFSKRHLVQRLFRTSLRMENMWGTERSQRVSRRAWKAQISDQGLGRLRLKLYEEGGGTGSRQGYNSPHTGREGARMGAQAKRVVFRYNDNDKDTDVEVDILGDLPQYAVGDIVARRG